VRRRLAPTTVVPALRPIAFGRQAARAGIYVAEAGWRRLRSVESAISRRDLSGNERAAQTSCFPRSAAFLVGAWEEPQACKRYRCAPPRYGSCASAAGRREWRVFSNHQAAGNNLLSPRNPYGAIILRQGDYSSRCQRTMVSEWRTIQELVTSLSPTPLIVGNQSPRFLGGARGIGRRIPTTGHRNPTTGRSLSTQSSAGFVSSTCSMACPP